jgi:hypothetical protein
VDRGDRPELIRQYGDARGINAQNGVGYLCGHPEMIELGKGNLTGKVFLREEIYWILSKETGGVEIGQW